MSDRGAPEPGDGGWLLSAIPLQLNDGPTAACPPGGKTLLREEGSPRALPSLKLVADNRSNLVSSSVKCSPPSPPTPTPPPTHPPSCPTTSPGSECPGLSGARQQRPIVVFRVHLADAFPSLSLEFFSLSQRQEKTCFLLSRQRTLPSFQHSGIQQKTHHSYLQGHFVFQAPSNGGLSLFYCLKYIQWILSCLSQGLLKT